jgi:hypothetical protein
MSINILRGYVHLARPGLYSDGSPLFSCVRTQRTKLQSSEEESNFVIDASKPDLIFLSSAWDLPSVGTALRSH